MKIIQWSSPRNSFDVAIVARFTHSDSPDSSVTHTGFQVINPVNNSRYNRKRTERVACVESVFVVFRAKNDRGFGRAKNGAFFTLIFVALAPFFPRPNHGNSCRRCHCFEFPIALSKRGWELTENLCDAYVGSKATQWQQWTCLTVDNSESVERERPWEKDAYARG